MTTTPALTGAERTAARIGYLSKTDLFQDLTPPELAEIERKITMYTCDRGRVFYLPGETGEALYILKGGTSPAVSPVGGGAQARARHPGAGHGFWGNCP